jgi:hypothetical protein
VYTSKCLEDIVITASTSETASEGPQQLQDPSNAGGDEIVEIECLDKSR